MLIVSIVDRKKHPTSDPGSRYFVFLLEQKEKTALWGRQSFGSVRGKKKWCIWCKIQDARQTERRRQTDKTDRQTGNRPAKADSAIVLKFLASEVYYYTNYIIIRSWPFFLPEKENQRETRTYSRKKHSSSEGETCCVIGK